MHVERRTVLQAGGLIAVGGLVAACSSSGDAAATTSAPATSASSAPAASASSAPASSAAGSAAAGALAKVSDVPVGSGLIIADPAVVITHPDDGTIKAFSAICTHQGCLVGSVENNEILCPCHGSKFSATDGSVIQGPATQPLPEEKVVVDDNGTITAA